MNNTDTTTTASTIKFANVSEWLPVTEAKAFIAKLIQDGTYLANELTRSSNVFTNRKDKSEGYSCRVRAIAGKHPELEIAPAKRGRKPKAKVESEVKKQPGKRGRKPKKAEAPADEALISEVSAVVAKAIKDDVDELIEKKAEEHELTETVVPVEVIEDETIEEETAEDEGADIWFEAV